VADPRQIMKEIIGRSMGV